MSDWNGPGLYRIEAGSKRSCRVSLAGGNKADGTKILCWVDDVNKNDVFAITYAGIGKTGKHEYHIINNNSGSFMTYPDGAPQGKQLTGDVMSPSNDRTRWSIIPLRNGSGQYWQVNATPEPQSWIALLTITRRITPVANSKMYLNINSNKTENGTEIWLYSDGNHPSCKWYLRLADDVFKYLNCPDVGKGK